MNLSHIAYILLKKKSNNILIQLFRYGFVGGIAFVVDFGFLWMLTEKVGLHYQASACISFILGLVTNYFLSVKWVFSATPGATRPSAGRLAEFAAYALIGVIGLGLNAFIIWLLTEKFFCHYLFSKLVSTFIVFMWNFLARRVLMLKS